jgi:hypothetical protein
MGKKCKIVLLKIRSLLFLIFLCTFFALPAAFSSSSLSYSGRLVNADGSPVTGSVNLTVDLAYTDNTGATPLCTQSFLGVGLTNGVFHLKLDLTCSPSFETILEQIPANESIAIRITDDTHGKVYSYQALHSMPMSHMSNKAKNLVDMGATDGHVLTFDNGEWKPLTPAATASGSIGTNELADGSVTDPKVATGISRGKLATGTPNYVLINDGSGFVSEAAQIQIDQGGTGAATAAGARANLGIVIGTTAGMFMGADAVPTCAANEKLTMTVVIADYLWDCIPDGDATKLPLAGGQMSGAIDMFTNRIIDLGTPINPGDAVNKTYVDTEIAAVNASQWTTNGSNIHFDTGNVGLGTATPTQKLDVIGNIALSGKAMLQSDNANYVEVKAPLALASTLSLTLPGTAGSAGYALTTDGNGILSWSAVATTSTNLGGDLSGPISNAQIVAGAIIDADVSGTAAIAQSKIAGLTTDLAAKEPAIAAGATAQYWRGDKSWQTLNSSIVPEVTNLYFTKPRVLGTDLAGLSTTAGTVTATDTVLSSIGKLVGNVDSISASQANYVLKVGDTMSGALAMGSNPITGLAEPIALADAATKNYVDIQLATKTSSQWITSGSDIYYNSGRVGIGLANPISKLTIQTATAPSVNDGANALRLEYDGGDAAGAQGAGLIFAQRYDTTDTAKVRVGGIYGYKHTPSTGFGGGLQFFTQPTGAVNMMERLRIDSAGNVGIGTLTPGYKLDLVEAGGPAKFRIQGNSGATTTRAELILDRTASERGGGIRIQGSTAAAAEWWAGVPYNSGTASDTFTIGRHATQPEYVTNSFFTISSAGNVGIGKTIAADKLDVVGNVALTGNLRLKSDTANFVELKAPIGLAANLIFNLPGTLGTSGQALVTDGAGVLSWSDVATTASAVGGDLSGTIANAQIISGAVGSAEVADGSIVDADVSLTAAIAQSKIAGLTTDLATKEPTITAGTTAQYWRGDKTWQTLNTTVVPEGTNLYFLESRVRAALLSGYAVGSAVPVAATDTLLEALGKLEAQIIANDAAFDSTGQWSKNVSDIYFNTGNVGIGTTTPAAKLHVYGNGLIQSADSVTLLGLSNTSIGGRRYNLTTTGDADIIGGGRFGIYDSVASTYRFAINSLGNIGIGTTAPVSKLNIASGRVVVGATDIGNTADGYVVHGTASGSNYGYQAGQSSTNNITFGWSANSTATSAHSYIEAYGGNNHLGLQRMGGNVGIGVPAANVPTLGSKLVIQGSTSDNTASSLNVTNSIAGSLLFVRNDGNTGIGTSSPTEKLHVAGNVLSAAYLYTSDERFKKNISEIPNALDKVLAFRGVTFDWRVDEYPERNLPMDKTYGFIAQDVEKEAPELVKTGQDGFKSVQYGNITALLVEAIKELSNKFETYSDRTNKVERKIASLEKENEELKIDIQELKEKNQKDIEELKRAIEEMRNNKPKGK